VCSTFSRKGRTRCRWGFYPDTVPGGPFLYSFWAHVPYQQALVQGALARTSIPSQVPQPYHSNRRARVHSAKGPCKSYDRCLSTLGATCVSTPGTAELGFMTLKIYPCRSPNPGSSICSLLRLRTILLRTGALLRTWVTGLVPLTVSEPAR
jgi:hypothetical protein